MLPGGKSVRGERRLGAHLVLRPAGVRVPHERGTSAPDARGRVAHGGVPPVEEPAVYALGLRVVAHGSPFGASSESGSGRSDGTHPEARPALTGSGSSRRYGTRPHPLGVKGSSGSPAFRETVP